MSRKAARLRRARRTRLQINMRPNIAKLVVHRTPRHIYAQIIHRDQVGQSKVLMSASTIDKEVRGLLKGNKTEQAKIVGNVIGERADKAGIKKVAFDRSGFKYHGRIKALAEAARAKLDF